MVGVVIVTFNGKKWIRRCIESILASVESEITVIVVDNASQDGTPEIVKSNFPAIQLICNNRNLGFAAANNLGIRKMLDKACDYVFLLNQDTTVEPGSISNLLQAAQESKFPAIYSPMQMGYDGKKIDTRFSNVLGRSSKAFI